MRFSSSKVFSPSADSHSRPFESQARPCTLRWPRLYTRGADGNGLPGAPCPVGVTRRILPFSELRSCARLLFLASPVPSYSMPSGPNAMRPPLWNWFFLRPVTIGSVVVPSWPLLNWMRTTRLSEADVWYTYSQWSCAKLGDRASPSRPPSPPVVTTPG